MEVSSYLTLPYLFLMLSDHYLLAFATEYSWIIASLVFFDGGLDPALFQHPPRL